MTTITSRPTDQLDEKDIVETLIFIATDPLMPVEGALLQVRGALCLLKIIGVIEDFNVVPCGTNNHDFEIIFNLPGEQDTIGIFSFK
jgi:hypothetical protein